MSRQLRARGALVPLIVAATLALTACTASAPATSRSSIDAPPGGDQTQPPSSGETTDAPRVSDAPDDTPQAVDGDGDACSLITDEEASAVLGITITRNEEGSSDQIPEGEGGGCIKGNERQADIMQIAIVSYSWFRGPGEVIANFFDGASAIEDAESVSGVGDRAVFSPSGGFLIATRGDTAFTMQVSRSGTERGSQEEVAGLARLLMERVP
ncbi:hypothetical protein BH20CHL8_BH20CHL8_07490 [soil metagenome]